MGSIITNVSSYIFVFLTQNMLSDKNFIYIIIHNFSEIPPPVLQGVDYVLSKATNGGKVWKDRDYKFGNLPHFLVGAHYFQTPVRVNRDVVLTIDVYGPAIIYVSSEGGSRSGGFESTLPNDGWVRQDGVVSTGCCSLSNLWKKRLANGGLNTITLPAISTNEMVGSILVSGMITVFEWGFNDIGVRSTMPSDNYFAMYILL